MKTRIIKARHAVQGIIASGLVLSVVGPATAVNVHGSICQVSQASDDTENGREVGEFGVINLDDNESLQLFCPIPVAGNVGASQQFNVFIEDKSNTNFFDCRGSVLNELGDLLCVSSAVNNAPASNTGQATLSFSCNGGTSSSEYSYLVDCFVPPEVAAGPSELQAIKVF